MPTMGSPQLEIETDTLDEVLHRLDYLRDKGSSEIVKLKEKVKSQKERIADLTARLDAQQVCIEVICSLLSDCQETQQDCVLAASLTVSNFKDFPCIALILPMRC